MQDIVSIEKQIIEKQADEIRRLKSLIELGCKRISDLELAHLRIISIDDDQEVDPHVLADISREVMKL